MYFEGIRPIPLMKVFWDSQYLFEKRHGTECEAESHKRLSEKADRRLSRRSWFILYSCLSEHAASAYGNENHDTAGGYQNHDGNNGDDQYGGRRLLHGGISAVLIVYEGLR